MPFRNQGEYALVAPSLGVSAYLTIALNRTPSGCQADITSLVLITRKLVAMRSVFAITNSCHTAAEHSCRETRSCFCLLPGTRLKINPKSVQNLCRFFRGFLHTGSRNTLTRFHPYESDSVIVFASHHPRLWRFVPVRDIMGVPERPFMR